MMPLCRMTSWGMQQLTHQMRDGVLVEDPGPESGWYEQVPVAPSIGEAFRRVGAAPIADVDLDAEHAIMLRETLPFSRRHATDRLVWPWLAAFYFRAYTLQRWGEADELTFSRVSKDLAMNSLARLWWGAENSKVANPRELTDALNLPASDDPWCFTRMFFKSQTLALEISRRLFHHSRAATLAFITVAHRRGLTATQISRTIATYNLALSTIVVEHFDLPTDQDGTYATDPERIADLTRLVETLVEPVLQE
ncbi:MAG: hypothetical protein CMJ83_01245 [Planctomycetes bacterium]|jgi:hypothetical protein|nr:hypothetical protein [Planctomycetota bacterium]